MENIYSNQRLNIETEETIIIWPDHQKEETIDLNSFIKFPLKSYWPIFLVKLFPKPILNLWI